MVEASTHVPGTKDRSVIMFWLPDAWGSGQEALEAALKFVNGENLDLVRYWQQGDRHPHFVHYLQKHLLEL